MNVLAPLLQLCGIAALCVSPAVTVPLNASLTLSVPGASAAYAIDSTVVQAAAQGGVVRVHAVGGGATAVIVIVPGGTQTFNVTVSVPHVVAALGAGASAGGPGEIGGGGSYTGSYASSTGQLINGFDFREHDGDRFRRAVLVTASAPVSGASGTRATGFPLLSYEVGGPGYDITYLDAAVNVSPLTFSDVLVRGVHVRTGPWTFHAGASSVATFDSDFIPVNPQWLAGVSRTLRAGPDADYNLNLYDVIDTAGSTAGAPGGIVGSLLYSYHPKRDEIVQGEVGLSHGLGFAFQAAQDGPKEHFDASFVDKPAAFATLAADAQQGMFGTLDYTRSLNDALQSSTNVQGSSYALPQLREQSFTAQENLTYGSGRPVSFTAGALYTQLHSVLPIAFDARTLGIPIGVNYVGRHFSAGLQDTPTIDFAGTFANGYGANAGYNGSNVQLGAFYRRDVQIPTIASIFGQVPGFQAALAAAGISITDPAQIASILSDSALLARLGFPGLQIDLAPVRDDTGFNLTWFSPQTHRDEVSLNLLRSDAELTQGLVGFTLSSLTYSRRISDATRIDLSYSLLQGTQTSGTITSHSSTPSFGVTLQHRFASAPPLLFPMHAGTVQGYVFRDDRQRGRYASGDPGLAGVDVTLDGDRTVRTSADGRYVFRGVAPGEHQVAAHLSGSPPYSFTTDSPALVSAGGMANFGVSYIAGKIFGNVTNDAGQGVGGVTVRLIGRNEAAVTGSDGSFTFEGLPEGLYRVNVAPDSFPPGYDLSQLRPQTAVVDGVPGALSFTARALRSISGIVTVFDPRRSSVVPAAGMEVSLPPLGRVARTDENGAYTLRDLPPGSYTLVIAGGTPDQRRTVQLPAEPANVTGVDFRVTSQQTGNRPRGRKQARPPARSQGLPRGCRVEWKRCSPRA